MNIINMLRLPAGLAGVGSAQRGDRLIRESSERVWCVPLMAETKRLLAEIVSLISRGEHVLDVGVA